jgi:hypothetical protein
VGTRIFVEAKEARSVARKIDGTKPSPRTREAEQHRRGQNEQHAAARHQPERLALDPERLEQDDGAEQDQDGGKHEREEARTHAKGGAELHADRTHGEIEPEGDEDRAAERVGPINDHAFSPR